MIDAREKELDDWRLRTLCQLRVLINQADPEVVEESKWAKASNPGGVPVWSHDGIICTGEALKNYRDSASDLRVVRDTETQNIPQIVPLNGFSLLPAVRKEVYYCHGERTVGRCYAPRYVCGFAQPDIGQDVAECGGWTRCQELTQQHHVLGPKRPIASQRFAAAESRPHPNPHLSLCSKNAVLDG